MTHDPKDDDQDELDRAAILARRSRFVAAAVAGLAGASLIAACGGSVTDEGDASPQPCLSPAVDAAPQPCLEPPIDRDAEPQPCLSPLPPDGGDDAGDAAASDGGDAGDAGPQPCLAPPPG